MWMSDTHPSLTRAKLLLQLPSPSCLLGLSCLKPEQLTATHPSSCSPHPYNLRVTHDSLFLLISPLSLAPSTSSSFPLHPLSTSAIDSTLKMYPESSVFSPPASQTLSHTTSVSWMKERASSLLFVLLLLPHTVRSQHSSQSSSFKYRSESQSPLCSPVVSSKSQSGHHSP